MNSKNTNSGIVLFISEGASISPSDDTITTVESDTFKYFRIQFTTVAKNRISVEVRDIQGEFLTRSASRSCIKGRKSLGQRMGKYVMQRIHEQALFLNFRSVTLCRNVSYFFCRNLSSLRIANQH